MAALEDEHLDVLQNIEFAIVSVYREKSDLLDLAVMRALDALIDVYRAEARGHTPKAVSLPEPERIIFERARAVCKTLHGDDTTADVILACMRKIRKSVEKWDKRGGQQGYLRFVSQYVM